MDDIARRPVRRPEDIGQVSRSPGVIGNAWVVAGTRVPTEIVWSLHQAGYDSDMILTEYPFLTREDVDAAIDHERQRQSQDSRKRKQHRAA